MFTGIIEKIGKVHSIDRKGDSSVIGLQINEVDYSLGDSVCINGVCLTVEKIHQDIYSFSISPETNNLTNLFLKTRRLKPRCDLYVITNQ